MNNDQAIREFIKQNVDFSNENKTPIKLFIDNGEISSIIHDRNYLETRRIENNVAKYLESNMKMAVIPIINREDVNKVKGQKIFLAGLNQDKDYIISVCLDELKKHSVTHVLLNNKELSDFDVGNQKYNLNRHLGVLLKHIETLPKDSQYELNIEKDYNGFCNFDLLSDSENIILPDSNKLLYDKKVINNFANMSETKNIFLKINDIPVTNIRSDLEEKLPQKSMKIMDILDQIKGNILLDRVPNVDSLNYILKNGILEKTIPGNGLRINIESDSSKNGMEILNHLFKSPKKAIDYIENSFLKMDDISESSPLYGVKNCLFETHVAKQDSVFSENEKLKTLPSSIRIDQNNDKILGGRYLLLWRNMVDEVMSLSDRENGAPINIGILTSGNDKKSDFYSHPLTDEKYFFINPNFIKADHMAEELTSLIINNNLLSHELVSVLQSGLKNSYESVWNQFGDDIDGSNITFSSSIEAPVLSFPKKQKQIEIID